MLALRRSRGGEVSLQEIDAPTPGSGEALVAVQRAGVCNTDLEIARGYLDFAGTMGHEFVGRVVDCPETAWIGKRVVGEINVACTRCDSCRRGLGRHCTARTVLGIRGKDGCFASHLTLPIANLHPIPDGLSVDAASFVEPTAAAFEILEQVAIVPSDRVLVVGDGKLGLLIAMVLIHHGCKPTVVGRHPDKLAIVAALGARTATDPASVDTGFDVAVEATGAPSGFAFALDRLRARGTLVLKSTYHGRLELDASRIVVSEITVVGSRCGPFAPAIEALASGGIDPRPLIHARFALDDGLEALARAQHRGVLKVLLDIENPPAPTSPM